MEVLFSRCAGLDVHKETVVACVRSAEAGRVRQEVLTFATTTHGLLELSDWLSPYGCTHVAIRSTPVSIGSQCGMSSSPALSSCSPTLLTFATSRGARGTLRSGRSWPIIWRTG